MADPSTSSAVVELEAADGDDQSSISDALSGSNNNNNNNTQKREGEGEAEDAKRRRFLWPDALHKDFIAAIFDVGLRHAEPSAVLECIARDDPRSSGAISLTNVQAQISKLQQLRERSQKEHSSFYERSMVEEGRKQSSVALINTSLESDRLSKSQKLYLLRKQLEVVNNTISVQSNFLQLVKSSLEAQLKMQSAAIRLISQLDPSYSPSVPVFPHPAPHPAPPDHIELSTKPESALDTSQSARPELQIISEMRTHMGLHRQLLLRKEDQVAQFTSEQPGEFNDWTWEDDGLDEHLFNFLASIPASSNT